MITLMKQKLNIAKIPSVLPGEIWGVASYFNPTNSPLFQENVELFSQSVRSQGLKLLIVELAFGNAPFEVDDKLADIVVRKRSNTVLWQKERLINLGIESLPSACDKVVWLDADILFENNSWVEQTSELLQSYVMLQPYQHACWLPRGSRTADKELPRGLGEGHTMPSMAFTLAHHTDHRKAMSDYFEHGHCGFAWAARRQVLDKHKLYDRRILGGGDVAIAHSLYGDRDFWRGFNFYCRQITKKELSSIKLWGECIYEDVSGSVFYVEGRILHLWHGEMAQRSYLDRQAILKDNDYDPETDITIDDEGCWKWNSQKTSLHQQTRLYFDMRISIANGGDC
ncbi:MAG: hypothetical protein JNN15_13175 [Blastocatellia bacterium]|nr:hypothetical protein [Blastocatellia bacterium]